ncbi:hypothetical protein K1T71_012411 [Dendrolimus kikuchii]|uniref:Uncharacterized protein n=1 Tax=Dendrolimus kikuchii TaxID=765133 RepID=A0ACC1CJ81_9NEOP|nr:hypothetical protein K1T71_012411 [Dendrolimus kikuchii]
MRQFLALDDLSPLTSSDEEGIVPPLMPPPKAAAKGPEAKRGRGRPPTTGEYVGLAEAKQKYVEAQRAALALETEKEIVERASAMATTRVTRSRAAPTLASQPSPEASAEHAQGLKQQITDSLAVVSGVAKVSKGLKGTLQKALKEAAAAIQEASEELLSRTSSEEVALLRAANCRMESEIADLRNELQKLQTELVRPRVAAPPPVEPPPNVESVMAANLERMTLLFESRFAAMEERMRSAQLASSPRPAPTPSPAPPSRRSLPSSPSMLRPSAEEFPPLPSQRVSTETVVTECIPPPPTCPAPLPSSAAADEGWTTVSKRKRKAAQPPSGTQPAAAAANAPTTRARRQRGRGRGGKRKGDEAQAPASQPPPPPPPPPKKETRARGRKVPRLRPPKSSAVVLTMQSGAEERGVTYASLLSQAKANIRLADLGIEGGLRLKRARTGARMLVVPGATSAPQADALAVSLRTVLKAEDVRVSRPEKAVYVRVSGLDDTTEGEDVAAAIARTTGCSLESIKATKARVAATKNPPPAKGEKAREVARNEALRRYLALDDLDAMMESSSSLSSSDEEERPAPKTPAKAKAAAKAPDAKRGRGRPPTTGEYVGLADAKKALVEAQRAELELQAEKEIVEQASAMATVRLTRLQTGPPPESQAPPDARVAHAEGLQRQIADSLAVVTNVAKVSKGLKGTLQKALKDAAAAIQEASEELLSRTSSEEVALLRAANSRMEVEIADLRKELRSLQTEPARPRAAPAPPPADHRPPWRRRWPRA